MKKPSISFSHFDLLQACKEPGCPLCRLSSKAVDDFLSSIIHESVNDPEVRAGLRQSLGFCRAHAWRLQHTGAGALLSIAIIYQDLANHTRRTLEKARYEETRGLPLPRLAAAANRNAPNAATRAAVQSLQASHGCLACALEGEGDRIAAIALMDALAKADETEMRAALQGGDPLCLPHLRRALELARSPAAFHAVIDITVQKLAAVSAEMGEFIRKHDYRFQDEPMGAEGTSWQRGLAAIIGEEAGIHTRKKTKR